MLLKLAVSASICSTFEVQYGESTSTRTTAIRPLGHPQQITWFRACADNHMSFNTGPWIIFADIFNYFHRRSTEGAWWIGKSGSGIAKNVIVFDPLLTSHVIRCMRSGRVRILWGNQRETLWLINQELKSVGSSSLVAMLVTWPAMHCSCSRSKGYKVTWRISRKKRYNSAVYGRWLVGVEFNAPLDSL